MADAQQSDDDEQDVELSDTEEKQVRERKATASRVVHEVIRRQGDDELDRPALSLMWSGLVGGIAISASLLGKSLFESHLPDAPWRPAVASIGTRWVFSSSSWAGCNCSPRAHCRR